MATTPAAPFIDHLLELRRRLLWSFLVLAAGAAVGYVYRDAIVWLLQRPLGMPLFYSSPSGSFQFIVSICLMVGALAAIPVLLYNLASFVQPAFARKHFSGKRDAARVIAISFTLMMAGAAFGYLVVLPMALHFFASFNIGPIKPLISTSEYLSFVAACLLTFAAIFQLPLLVLLINRVRRIPPGTLGRYQRHVIVGSLVVALVLPFTYDPLTQFVVAIPIVVLYEASALLVWAVNRRSDQREVKPGGITVAEAPLQPAADAGKREGRPGRLEVRRSQQLRPSDARPRVIQLG